MTNKFFNYNTLAIVLIASLFVQTATTITSKAETKIVKQLNVPYINQCLQKDNKTLWPNMIGSTPERIICRNMCLTTAATMVAGYFGKVDYDMNNTDTLKRYLVEDKDIPERVKDGKTTLGGAFALTSYTDANGNNNDNYAEGLINYGLRKGLITSGINWIPGDFNQAKSYIYQKAKEAIDRDNVLIISTKTHARVITGYTNDGQIVVNDSYRNTEIGKAGDYYNYNGKGAIYDLPTSGTSRPANPVEQFEYMIEFANSDANFYKNKTAYVDGMVQRPNSRIGKNIVTTNTSGITSWDSINIRKNIAEDIIGEAVWGTNGEVISEPKYGKGFYREQVKLNNGITGWIASNFLVDAQAPKVTKTNYDVKSTDYLIIRTDPTIRSYSRGIANPKDKGNVTQKTTTKTDGYYWDYVKWANGKEGWSASDYLKEI
jgi:hypothetical protein